MKTDVVAALIWKEKKFLVCRRPENKTRGGLWEFAGGKVEDGESLENALIRECREELGVTVSVGRLFAVVEHEYPDLSVRLVLFECEVLEGEPKLLEHSAFAWISTDEIDGYEFCPADKDILARLKTMKWRRR